MKYVIDSISAYVDGFVPKAAISVSAYGNNGTFLIQRDIVFPIEVYREQFGKSPTTSEALQKFIEVQAQNHPDLCIVSLEKIQKHTDGRNAAEIEAQKFVDEIKDSLLIEKPEPVESEKATIEIAITSNESDILEE